MRRNRALGALNADGSFLKHKRNVENFYMLTTTARTRDRKKNSESLSRSATCFLLCGVLLAFPTPLSRPGLIYSSALLTNLRL